MKPTKWSSIIVALLLSASTVLLAASCQGEDEASTEIGVVVTLQPQAQFVEEVGGDKVNVTVMVPPGASPHTYEPSPGQMKAVASAEIYAKVGSGVEFELVWLDNIIAQNNDITIVDCSDGIELIEMSHEHEHEDEGEGNHEEGMDPHIWMSPMNAKIMVENICSGLIEVDPDNRRFYESNRDAYLERLTELHRDIEDKLSDITNWFFMVFHPPFGYYAEEYGLTMIPIEEEGKEPTAAGLARLIEQAQEHDIKIVFAEPQFNPESARVIADAIEGTVAFIDPLAENYIENMRLITNELARTME